MLCVLRQYANSAYICIADFRKIINHVVTTPMEEGIRLFIVNLDSL